MQSPEHIYFVTGKLAEKSARSIISSAAAKHGFSYSIDIMPITVAALMTGKWLQRHWHVPPEADRVVLPGYLASDAAFLQTLTDAKVQVGPKDIRDLPLFFGENRRPNDSYGQHDIEIIAEINHAARLTAAELLMKAETLQKQGADIIDLGCTPGYHWAGVGDAVTRLRDAGHRVSVDSFDIQEIALACNAGAELVLSVNSSNLHAASDWNTEVVVIPDVPSDEKSLQDSVNFLKDAGVAMRLDPILEPIGCGFTQSILRYAHVRRKIPELKMMMGIGNITELTDSDSAGINVLLLGICAELSIQSVLTTQVINWSQTSVQECHLARQLVHYAVQQGVPPKHLEPGLVLLRDTRLNEDDIETLQTLAENIRDKNIRLSNSCGEIHAVSAGLHAHSTDPFHLMQQILDSHVGDSIDPSHAFYLGFEMCKALTALTLSKQYTQDQALNWGFLTIPEESIHEKRKKKERNELG